MRLVNPIRRLAGMSKKDHGAAPTAGPVPSVFYNVVFVHQNHINLCGDACASMLLLFRGKPALAAVDPSSKHANVFLMKDNPRGVLSGEVAGNLINSLKAAHLQVYDVSPAATAGVFPAWTAQTIGDALRAFGPLMISVAFNAVSGHWILLTGIQGNVVFHHDPWRGRNMAMSVTKLAGITSPQTADDCLAALPALATGVPATLDWRHR